MSEQQTAEPRRALICGGRNWNDEELTFEALDILHRKRPFSVVIHGAASGADTLAGRWAKSKGIPVQEFPADWRPAHLGGRTDRGAGYKRNLTMLHDGKPDIVIAFPGGSGTRHMMNSAMKAAVPVIDLHDIRQWKADRMKAAPVQG